MFNETSPMRETEQISEVSKDQTINDLIQTSVVPSFEQFREKISQKEESDSKPTFETKSEIAEVFAKNFGAFARAFIDAQTIDLINDDQDEHELIKEINDEFSPLYKKFSDRKIYSVLGEGPNCYCFALDVTLDSDGDVFTRRPGLGHWSGECTSSELQSLLQKSNSDDRLFEIIEADCEAMGKGFKRVDENYTPKNGEILGAFMYSTTLCDFHFARSESGEFWYHKQGLNDPIITDLSGKFITRPEDSDWGMYDQFCGRFVTWDKK